MHRSWWVYPRHPLLRRTWRSSDNGGVEANAVSATVHALITKQGV